MPRCVFVVTVFILFFSHCRAVAQEQDPDVILGSCLTLLSDNYNRTKNIELALKKLHGLVVDSGREFSFNSVVGPRSAARGYLPAPVLFQDKKSIQLGGGICQVSSTLYNAVLLSDLEILERHRHSSPITYLPLGLDATVVYWYKDLRFRNSHPFPIMILTSMSEGTMTISVLGREKLPYDVELVTRVTEIESPFPGASSEDGKEVIIYRVRSRDAKVIEKEYIGRDYYHPSGGDW